MRTVRLLFPQGEEIWCIQSLPVQKLFNSSAQAVTFSAALPVPSHPAGDRVTRAAHSVQNTGTSQVRAGKAFSFLFHSFSVNSFLFDEVAFLQASGLRASVM